MWASGLSFLVFFVIDCWGWLEPLCLRDPPWRDCMRLKWIKSLSESLWPLSVRVSSDVPWRSTKTCCNLHIVNVVKYTCTAHTPIQALPDLIAHAYNSVIVLFVIGVYTFCMHARTLCIQFKGLDMNHVEMVSEAPVEFLYLWGQLPCDVPSNLTRSVHRLRRFWVCSMCRFVLVQAGRSFGIAARNAYTILFFAQQHCTFGCVALIAVMHVLLYELCDFRSGVMAARAVQQTSHTYNWLFLFYCFVVGVLFAELMVGILIATFGDWSEQFRHRY